MFLDMAIFAVLAYRYKYNYFSSGGEVTDGEEKDVSMDAIEGDNKREGGHTNASFKDD